MLIKCPKCRSVYDLPDNVITDQGTQMRCAECHEVWTAYLDDAIKEKQKNKHRDIQKMFERVSKETAPLFENQQTKVVEKIKVVNVTRYKHTINLILFLIALVCVLGILYYMRFDIVRLMPQSESWYERLYIDSIPYGKNLEFQSITTREFTEDNVAKIEISGAIVNIGKYQTKLPPLKIQVFDKSEKLLFETVRILSLPRLQPSYHLLFNIVINNPTPYGKLIYVKFVENSNLSGE